MTRASAATFEITISGTQPPYDVTVTSPGVDEPIRTILPAINEWLTDDLRTILAEMAKDISNTTGEKIQQVGEVLYIAIFTREIERAFDQARGSAKAKGQSLRLCLQIEPPELTALPWEIMHDSQDWLAMRSETPLVRRVLFKDDWQELTPLTIKRPLRILFVGASPADETGRLAEINIIEAERQLVNAIEGLQKGGHVQLYCMLNPSFEELKEELSRNYHILVFLGHGSSASTAENGSACIYLDATTDTELEKYPFLRDEQKHRAQRTESSGFYQVDAEALASALEGKPTRLIVLAACNTAMLTNDNGLLLDGLAQILAKHVSAIIAMQYFITIDSGMQFAEYFLRALAVFRQADEAVVQARNALVDRHQLSRDHFSPVMYLQVDDGALFQQARNWVKWILAVGLPLLIMMLVTIWGILRFYEQKQREALSEQLTAEALTKLEENPPLALLLAAEGLQTRQRVSETVSSSALVKVYRLLSQTGGTPLPGHTNDVLSVAFCCDGRWLATASKDGTARLWDTTNPNAAPRVLRGHHEGVLSVVFSSDDRWLATTSLDNTALLWDMKADDPSAKPQHILAHEGDVFAAAFSPNGNWLATVSGDNFARLWDTTNFDAPPHILPGHTENVLSVAFSHDGHWLATASVDDTALLWDMHDLRTPKKLSGHSEDVFSLAFSPDSHWLATASFDDSARLWDMTAKDPSVGPRVLTGHLGDIVSVAFSPDSYWLATASKDNTATLWNVTMDDPNAAAPIIVEHQDDVLSVAFSGDGRWLVTTSKDKTAHLWDVTNPRARISVIDNHKRGALIGHEASVTAAVFSRNSRWFATASDDDTARLWDVTSPNANPRILAGHKNLVKSVAFSPDRRWLASASLDGAVRLWDMDNLSVEPRELAGDAGWVYSVAFSSDSHWLSGTYGNGTACLWYMTSLNDGCRHILTGHSAAIEAIAFSANGDWLATGSDDTTVRLWNSADFGADSRVTITSTTILTDHAEGVLSVAFSPNNRWLATASRDDTVLLWDMTDLTVKPRKLDEHKEDVSSVAFSPDSNWLATASEDHMVFLWDMTEITSTLPFTHFTHSDNIRSVAFSPDSNWLATASDDNRAYLWDLSSVHTFSEFVTLVGHDGDVYAVAFSPNGHWLATASKDHTVRLWELRVEDLITTACRFAGRNLTDTEWHTYMQDRKYTRTCEQWPEYPSVGTMRNESQIATPSTQ